MSQEKVAKKEEQIISRIQDLRGEKIVHFKLVSILYAWRGWGNQSIQSKQKFAYFL